MGLNGQLKGIAMDNKNCADCIYWHNEQMPCKHDYQYENTENPTECNDWSDKYWWVFENGSWKHI